MVDLAPKWAKEYAEKGLDLAEKQLEITRHMSDHIGAMDGEIERIRIALDKLLTYLPGGENFGK